MHHNAILFLNHPASCSTQDDLFQGIHNVMAPFFLEPADTSLLEFEDRTAEYLADFNKIVPCAQMPDGKLLEVSGYLFRNSYAMKDGKIHRKNGDTLQRSTEEEQIQLLSCPRSRLFGSFEEFVEEEYGGCYNEETDQYGEWLNPLGVFEWFYIGGRWANAFLVKTDCTEYARGENCTGAEPPAPEGYRWVACARKKDIQWEAMRQWRNQKALENYHLHKSMSETGNADPNCYQLNGEGDLYYMGDLIYFNGETPEEYLQCHGFPKDLYKYPLKATGIFHEQSYVDESGMTYGKALNAHNWATKEWSAFIAAAIDEADDDAFLVSIDFRE